MRTWEPHPEGPHSHQASSLAGADYDPSPRPEGEPCSSLERNRVCEEGYKQGEWDCSQGTPMNPDPASGYPKGSTLDLDYRAGYRSGHRSYTAEIREERVRVWRNSRRALRSLKPIPVEYWRAECNRLDAAGDHKGLEHAQGMYQEACDFQNWKLRLGVPNQ